jgi:hypothetical protein
MAARGEVTVTLMDKDTMSSDGNMASYTFAFPPPQELMSARLELAVNAVLGMNDDAKPLLDVNCLLLPLADIMKAPASLLSLSSQQAAATATDVGQAAEAAALLAQLEAMAIGDTDDEQAKSDLMEKTAAVEAAAVTEKAAAAEAEAAKNAEIQAAREEAAATPRRPKRSPRKKPNCWPRRRRATAARRQKMHKWRASPSA